MRDRLLAGLEGRTLEEMGRIFQCPKERVRQIEARKLRRPQQHWNRVPFTAGYERAANNLSRLRAVRQLHVGALYVRVQFCDTLGAHVLKEYHYVSG